MESRSFYNEILTEHNIHPEFKHDLPDADLVLEGVNPNCGDDIFLKLKLDGDEIVDGAFVGDGCAISQASGHDCWKEERGSAAFRRIILKNDKRRSFG